ncbi:uncharacterized protein LOC108606159 [Drosophila busckii]|uniref:uncharacterized protein LOC108606159 n=1 Tax=Drosophila busckii TaxID=30019 RepID=UPI00083ED6D0|nr:uncharacterized protein LOC108606159 [Drosophila busckii]
MWLNPYCRVFIGAANQTALVPIDANARALATPNYKTKQKQTSACQLNAAKFNQPQIAKPLKGLFNYQQAHSCATNTNAINEYSLSTIDNACSCQLCSSLDLGAVLQAKRFIAEAVSSALLTNRQLKLQQSFYLIDLMHWLFVVLCLSGMI